MTFKQIKKAIYATYITNLYGYKLKKINNDIERKKIRFEYCFKVLTKLDLEVKVINPQKIPQDGQFLIVSNHKSVIDALIIDVALQNSKIFGYWVSKKELYNSFFFGLFVRNAGTIFLDREASNMSGFFKDVKSVVKKGQSISIFPEGTRLKGDLALGEFKEGSKIIAVKNRLDILPIYIKNNANYILMESLKGKNKVRTLEIEFGDIIGYKDRSKSLQQQYKEQFNIK
ncbi:MAG: 1-acyl-sn-glycerol-3-phosphate acyltransferase [Sulfurimonas sp.]|nr:1-acyl-sn-glycerol-3-phosphate acyltransferase [Sulfurimonas sp.]